MIDKLVVAIILTMTITVTGFLLKLQVCLLIGNTIYPDPEHEQDSHIINDKMQLCVVETV
jgi:hypothetical protein